jgi:hypothetical protein
MTYTQMSQENEIVNIEDIEDIEDLSDTDEPKNLCTECGRDMGPQNPRQLCGKTYCIYAESDDESTIEIVDTNLGDNSQ